MNVSIRRVRDGDVDALVELTLLAFVPVFGSFRDLLGPAIYSLIWPDWQKRQRESVEKMCGDSAKHVVLVAEVGGAAVGLLAYGTNTEDRTGEIQFLAVHPEFQNRGVGTELNEQALREMRDAGVTLAIVETGGDHSHAPARRSYEKAGFTALPLVRYFKNL